MSLKQLTGKYNLNPNIMQHLKKRYADGGGVLSPDDAWARYVKPLQDRKMEEARSRGQQIYIDSPFNDPYYAEAISKYNDAIKTQQQKITDWDYQQKGQGPIGADNKTVLQRGYYLDEDEKKKYLDWLGSQQGVLKQWWNDPRSMMTKDEYDAALQQQQRDASRGIVPGPYSSNNEFKNADIKYVPGESPSWLKNAVGSVALVKGYADGGNVYDPNSASNTITRYQDPYAEANRLFKQMVDRLPPGGQLNPYTTGDQALNDALAQGREEEMRQLREQYGYRPSDKIYAGKPAPVGPDGKTFLERGYYTSNQERDAYLQWQHDNAQDQNVLSLGSNPYSQLSPEQRAAHDAAYEQYYRDTGISAGPRSDIPVKTVEAEYPYARMPSAQKPGMVGSPTDSTIGAGVPTVEPNYVTVPTPDVSGQVSYPEPNPDIPNWLKNAIGKVGAVARMADGGAVEYDPAKIDMIADQIRKEIYG